MSMRQETGGEGRPLGAGEERLRVPCSLPDIVLFTELQHVRNLLRFAQEGTLEEWLVARRPRLRQQTEQLNQFLLKAGMRPGGPGSGHDLTCMDDLRANTIKTVCVPQNARVVGQLLAIARAAALWELARVLTVDEIDRTRRMVELLTEQLQDLREEFTRRIHAYAAGRPVIGLNVEWGDDERDWNVELIVSRAD